MQATTLSVNKHDANQTAVCTTERDPLDVQIDEAKAQCDAIRADIFKAKQYIKTKRARLDGAQERLRSLKKARSEARMTIDEAETIVQEHIDQVMACSKRREKEVKKEIAKQHGFKYRFGPYSNSWTNEVRPFVFTTPRLIAAFGRKFRPGIRSMVLDGEDDPEVPMQLSDFDPRVREALERVGVKWAVKMIDDCGKRHREFEDNDASYNSDDDSDSDSDDHDNGESRASDDDSENDPADVPLTTFM